MGNDILQLKPQEVWRHFYSLTRIPRPSGHEDAVREFIATFGKNLGLKTMVDSVGNVIVRKPAAPGMENRKGVILQAHLDMVPQKNSGTVHDFYTDPIDIFFDGEWVRARGTTLGADNGIGVAAIMAVLESATMRHGPLEALFTSNEESGMTGAFGLKPGLLQGKILINLDSEQEGELSIGCAGGLNATMTFRYSEKPVPDGYIGFSIAVTGLKGGHSGVDIHRGRGNANKILNRLLYEGYTRHGMLLSAIHGGTLRNAIPREATAMVAVSVRQAERFLEDTYGLAAKIKQEFSTADPDLDIVAVSVGVPDRVIEERVAVNLFNTLCACPNGVMRMSDEIEGLVETSNNLAVVKSGEGAMTVECLLRSSVDSAREELQNMIRSIFRPAGAVCLFDGAYPGWKPNPGSPVLQIMKETYTKMFGKPPEIRSVHAGLECGIIGATYPGLDMISFGPTILYPHSPDEKVSSASVLRFRDVLVQALAQLPLEGQGSRLQ